MLPQFQHYPAINQNTLLSTDIETLKLWYTKYSDVYSELNQKYTLNLLCKQYKIYTNVSHFPDFYTQYLIKYFPLESNIPSFVIAGIAINNDDPDALSNLMKVTNYTNKFTCIKPEDVVRIFKSNKIKLIKSLDKYGTKHMIDGCRGIIHSKNDTGLHNDSICCAVACGYFDDLIKINARQEAFPNGLVIGGYDYTEVKRCMQILSPDSIEDILSIAVYHDRLDLVEGLELDGLIDIGQITIYLTMQLSATKIIKHYISTSVGDEQNKIKFTSILPLVFGVPDQYRNSCILTIQWLVEMEIITQTTITETRLFECICNNEDVESLLFLFNNFNFKGIEEISNPYIDCSQIIKRTYNKVINAKSSIF